MIIPKNIFIGGITGAGKSTVSTILQNKLHDSNKITIGTISCKIAFDIFSAKDIETLNIEKLNYCEIKTVEEILRIFGTTQSEYNILDGHFILGGINREDYKIPISFFEVLNLKLIILITGSEKVINERIRNSPEKGRPSLILNSIEYYNKLEKEYAYIIANYLNISIIEIDNDVLTIAQLGVIIQDIIFKFL